MKTINLIKGNFNSNNKDLENGQDSAMKAIEFNSRQFNHEKTMSNINEGVEFSTGRQDQEENEFEHKTIQSNHHESSNLNDELSKLLPKNCNGELIRRKEKTVWK